MTQTCVFLMKVLIGYALLFRGVQDQLFSGNELLLDSFVRRIKDLLIDSLYIEK